MWIQPVKDREIGAVFDRLCTAKNVKRLFPAFEFMVRNLRLVFVVYSDISPHHEMNYQ